VNDVGERLAGEPHEPFEGEGLDTRASTTAAKAEALGETRRLVRYPPTVDPGPHRSSPLPDSEGISYGPTPAISRTWSVDPG